MVEENIKSYIPNIIENTQNYTRDPVDANYQDYFLEVMKNNKKIEKQDTANKKYKFAGVQ